MDQYTTYDGTVISLDKQTDMYTITLPRRGYGQDIKLSMFGFIGRAPQPTDAVRISFKNDKPVSGKVI